jgi:hypothetical protein
MTIHLPEPKLFVAYLKIFKRFSSGYAIGSWNYGTRHYLFEAFTILKIVLLHVFKNLSDFCSALIGS